MHDVDRLTEIAGLNLYAMTQDGHTKEQWLAAFKAAVKSLKPSIFREYERNHMRAR